VKTVSAAFLVAQRALGAEPIRRVVMQRRSWDDDAGAFVWETDGLVISALEFSRTTVAGGSDLGETTYDPALGPLPQSATPAWTRSLGGNLTVNSETTTGGYLNTDTTRTGAIDTLSWLRTKVMNAGDYAIIAVKSSNWSIHSASPVSWGRLVIRSNTHAKEWQIRLHSDGVYDRNNALLYSMDCTGEHEYKLEVEAGAATAKLYVDGISRATGIDGGSSGFGTDTVFAEVRGTQVSQLSGWAYSDTTTTPDRVVTTPTGKNRMGAVSPLSQQLDSDQLNEFKWSNVTILVDNSKNEWDPKNPAGLFAGFEAYWTKFQIYVGYSTADGDELLKIFTGYMVDPSTDAGAGTCQLTILGPEALLLNADAEDVATHVVEEEVGTGDNSTTAFDTLNPGVGRVTRVTVDGVEVKEGVDFEVSNLNDKDLPATITFGSAPVSGAILVDYFYWPQSIEFDELVSQLLLVGGIPIPQQEVDPVVFSSGVINAKEFTTKADWDSGTKTRIDTATIPGSIRLDWEDASFREATGWATSVSGWTTYGAGSVDSNGTYLRFFIAPVGGKAPIGPEDTQIDRASNRLTGSWEFKAQIAATGVLASLGVKLFQAAGSAGYTDLVLTRNSGCTFLGVSFASTDDQMHTYKVVRTGAGVAKLYVDGVLTATATAPSSASALGFRGYVHGFANAFIYVQEIYRPTATATGDWLSPDVDWTTVPSAWLPFVKSDNGDDTITYETDSSPDGATWDGEQVVTGLYPSSTPDEFARVHVYFSVDQTTSEEPTVNSVKLQATSTSVPILLPNLTGKNIYEAIQTLASFANYEFGFRSDEDTDGIFFFRPKRVAADAVFSATQADQLSDVQNLTPGWDRVYSAVRVTYGAYTREIVDDGADATDPSARFSKKRFEFTADEDIQISPLADIATGVAARYYDELSTPRRAFTAQTKFLPFLELADVVDWTFSPNGYAFLDGVAAKIVGIRFDLDAFKCEIQAQEVA
jgi:hypothetical protein